MLECEGLTPNYSLLFQVPVQSGLFYLIYRQRYLRRWSPDIFAGRVVTLAALPAGNGDETESEGRTPVKQRQKIDPTMAEVLSSIGHFTQCSFFRLL